MSYALHPDVVGIWCAYIHVLHYHAFLINTKANLPSWQKYTFEEYFLFWRAHRWKNRESIGVLFKKEESWSSTTDLVSESVPHLCCLRRLNDPRCRAWDGLITWLWVFFIRFACLSGLQNVASTLYTWPLQYNQINIDFFNFFSILPITVHPAVASIDQYAVNTRTFSVSHKHIWVYVLLSPPCFFLNHCVVG